jgi:FHA domain
MKGGGVINLNELDFDIGDMMETMEENDKAIEEMEKPFEQKIAEAHEKREMAKTELVKMSNGNNKDKRLPHMTNLLEIEDQSFFAYYGLYNCPVYVGRKNGDPKPEIILEGSAIKPNHAVFELDIETGNISIKAASEEAGRKVKVNGETLDGRKRILHHMDRILFGFNTIFIFRCPLMKRKLEKLMRGRLLKEMDRI